MNVKEMITEMLTRLQWFDAYNRRRTYSPASLDDVKKPLYGQPIHFSRTDREQQQAIQLPLDQDFVLTGPRRSGKTQVLLHRAHYLCNAYHIPETQLKIMVFGNATKDHLRSLAGVYGLEAQTILTFDHWCKLYYQKNINKALPRDPEKNKPDFEAIRIAVLNSIRTRPQMKQAYDAILIDDGEDLPPIAFRIIGIISKHITVAIHRDKIFKHGSTVEEVKVVLGPRIRVVELKQTYIDSKYIAGVAAVFLPCPEERLNFQLQNQNIYGQYEIPQMFITNGQKNEQKVVAKIIAEGLERGDKIGILVSRQHDLKIFARFFRKGNIRVEVLGVRKGKKQEYVSNLKFDNSRPKLLTLSSAKGLLFDTVIMPHVPQSSLKMWGQEAFDALLFLGITRAKSRFYAITYGRVNPAPLKKILPLAEQGLLDVKRPSETIREIIDLGEALSGANLGPGHVPPPSFSPLLLDQSK